MASNRSETALQHSIIVALEQMGVWVIRTAVKAKRGRLGVRTGEPGMPDLCLPTLGWLEVKLPTKQLRPDQVAWHKKARSFGVRVAIVRTVNEAVYQIRYWRHETKNPPCNMVVLTPEGPSA